MPDYYDTIYRQVVKNLNRISTRPDDEKDENLCDFSCAIMTRENRDKSIDYEVVVVGDIMWATNQIKQRTDDITIQVDTNKLQNSYYLLQQADRLTHQLCNANLYDYVH